MIVLKLLLLTARIDSKLGLAELPLSRCCALSPQRICHNHVKKAVTEIQPEPAIARS